MGKKQRQRLVFLRYKRHKILNKKHNIKQPIKPNKMNTFTMYATIKVKVATNLSKAAAIEEFTENCDYFLQSTDNVKVIETEWEETNLSLTH